MNSTTSPSVAFNLSVEVNRAGTYVWPVLIVLIAVTNIMNIIVLSRRSLRLSSCTHYFLALAVGSLIYMVCTPVSLFLSNAFGISIGTSPVGCRILQPSVFSSSLFTTTMMVCSSIDRFCASSSSAWLRKFSTVYIAQRVIIIISISILIYLSPLTLVYYWNFNTNQCLQYSSTLISIYLYSRVILYYIIEPVAMIIFGLLTIHNIHDQTHRIAPLAGQNHRRTESQLTRLLIIQIGLHLFFSLPTAVTYTITTFLPSMITPLFLGLRTMSYMWQQGVFFLSFFLYILSATTFRKEFIKLFKSNTGNNPPTINTARTQRRFPRQRVNETQM